MCPTVCLGCHFLNSISSSFQLAGISSQVRPSPKSVITQRDKVDGLVLGRHQDQVEGQKAPGRKLAGPGGGEPHQICPAG